MQVISQIGSRLRAIHPLTMYALGVADTILLAYLVITFGKVSQ